MHAFSGSVATVQQFKLTETQASWEFRTCGLLNASLMK